jgi:hypothetical protein
MTLTIVCAWCRRDTGAGADDPRAIVGLCADHVTGFFDRVESLLTSCAALAAGRRKNAEAPAAPVPEETVADVLHKHGGLTLCDVCIAAELGWPPARVTAEAEALATPEFLRDYWRCARCGTRGLVTRVRTRGKRVLEKQAA